MAKRIVDEEMRFNIIVDGNEAQKELIDLEKSTRKLTRQNKEYRAEQAKLVKQGKKNTEEYKRLSAAIRENNITIKSNKEQMKTLQDQIGITGLSMRQLGQRASILRTQLANAIPGGESYKKYQAELSEINARLRELRVQANQTKFSMGSLADGFNRYAALGASVVATLTGVVLSIQKVIDYNGKLADAQSNVQKTTGLTKKEVDDLTKSFGAFKTRTARIELLQLAEEAGRLGVEGAQNIREFVDVANQMKVALGDDLGDDQIREVGKMVSVYKVGEKTGRNFKNSLLSLGSAINEVSASGANQAGFLVDYLKRQAGIAAQANISAENNLAYAATFDEIGQSVEVSATAMNKVWADMFTNTADYAEIAGMEVKDFSKLLNTDANAAMIAFLKGLDGNNAGLTVMLDKLKDLEVGGSRGVQALSALAANTKLLEERQTQSNKALQEATSLTNEYNLKNNNLAGTLDKVKKRFQAAFSSEAVTGTLNGLVVIFGRLIGAIDDVDKAFASETKATYDNVKANRQLINESQALLDEYNALTQDGVEPTIEQKERLDIITLQLKDRLGESVMSIDAETGAFILNTEAVREQIKIKRLAADEEAATLVSRRRGVQDAIADQEEELAAAQKVFEVRQNYFNQQNADDIKAIENARDLNAFEKQQMLERLDGYKELDKARQNTGKINQQLYEQNKRLADLNAKLADLNYTEADADSFFEGNTSTTTPPKTPSPITPTPSPIAPTPTKKPTGNAAQKAAQRARELLQIQRDAEDARIALIQDAFEREMAQEEANHRRKIEDLKAKKIDENLIKSAQASGNDNLADSYLQQNKEINSQIESETQLHGIRKAKIIDSINADRVQKMTQSYERERQLRETAFLQELNSIKSLSDAKNKLRGFISNEELSKIKTLNDAKAALTDQFNKEELDKQQAHLKELISLMEFFMNSGNFAGFDMSLLTPEQKSEFEAQIEALKLKIQELVAAKNKLSGKGEEDEGDEALDLGFGGELDVLGFSAQQWVDTFTNIGSLEEAINAASTAVQGFMNAWAMYHEFVNAKEKQELSRFEKKTSRQKAKQKNLLDSGLINKRQYEAAVELLDQEADKKKAEIEYKQAKRAWQMQLVQAIASTALGVTQALGGSPPPANFILAAITGVLGAVQIATISKNKPVKGYESGYYNVKRQQDGKSFNAAFGGETQSGVVDKPTVFLAGEGGKNFPEMIIDGQAFKEMSPQVKDALNSELARIKGFQTGYYKQPVASNAENLSEGSSSSSSSSSNYALISAALNRNSEILERLEANGITAYMSADLRNTKKMRDEIKRLEKIENKAKLK